MLQSSINDIDNFFLGTESPQNSSFDILCRLFNSNNFVRLSEKPRVYNSLIKQIIRNCIISNLEIKAIIKEAIEDEQLINNFFKNNQHKHTHGSSTEGVNGPEDDVVYTLKQSDFNRMYEMGLIDETGNLLWSKAHVARTLVESGLVQPIGGWNQQKYKQNFYRRYQDRIDSSMGVDSKTKFPHHST